MMDTQKHIETKPLKQMKIIFNNDMAIIDFLSDLKCRRVLKVLDECIKESPKSNCLLYNCKEDNLVILLLHNDPFGFNENGNHLVMYADPSLQNLAKYFKKQLDHTSPDAGDIYKAIDDITRLLFWRWASMEEENIQPNFQG